MVIIRLPANQSQPLMCPENIAPLLSRAGQIRRNERGELPARRIRLLLVPRGIQCPPEIEQVVRQIAVAHIEAEPLDRAASLDDCASLLPKRAPGARALLVVADRLAQRCALSQAIGNDEKC